MWIRRPIAVPSLSAHRDFFDYCALKILLLTYLLTCTGLGALAVSVEGAHRSDLEMKNTSPTEYTLQYKPHEPGIHLLNVKFGDDHVTGTIHWLHHTQFIGHRNNNESTVTAIKSCPAFSFTFASCVVNTTADECCLQIATVAVG